LPEETQYLSLTAPSKTTRFKPLSMIAIEDLSLKTVADMPAQIVFEFRHLGTKMSLLPRGGPEGAAIQPENL
jgi:hypothetical protein